MINLVKVKEETELNFPVENYERGYKLVKDEQTIGFGTINKDRENAFYIFINEEERGKGYGKILFSKILDESKNIGCNNPKVTFEKENIPMTKITVDNGGTLIWSDGEKVKYEISLK